MGLEGILDAFTFEFGTLYGPGKGPHLVIVVAVHDIMFPPVLGSGRRTGALCGRTTGTRSCLDALTPLSVRADMGIGTYLSVP